MHCKLVRRAGSRAAAAADLLPIATAAGRLRQAQHCGLLVCSLRLMKRANDVANLLPAQATKRGIWVSNIPSAGMGNALSCAEHVFYLTLALLRDAPEVSIPHMRAL